MPGRRLKEKAMAPEDKQPVTETVKTPAAPPAEADKPSAKPTAPAKDRDPTRYGDWERGGRCIDF